MDTISKSQDVRKGVSVMGGDAIFTSAVEYYTPEGFFIAGEAVGLHGKMEWTTLLGTASRYFSSVTDTICEYYFFHGCSMYCMY